MKKIYEKPELNIMTYSSVEVFALSSNGSFDSDFSINEDDIIMDWEEFF